MTQKKTIEFDIKDVLELLLKSSDNVLLNMSLQLDDIIALSLLVDEELVNITKDIKTDGSFDQENVFKFLYRYHISITEFDNTKKIFSHLKSIKDDLHQIEWECYSEQTYLEEFERNFPHPNIIIPEKPFPEWLRNIPSGKNEEFAKRLKNEFRTEIGLQIRYMVEGLINKNLLIIPNRMTVKFYKAMKIYFGRHIGAKSGIFDLKFENNDPKGKKYKIHEIKTAENRIESILNQIS